MRFFTGIFNISHAQHFNDNEQVFISVVRLRRRKSDFVVGDWILDSGAFSTIDKFGSYPDSPEKYAEEIRRWKSCGNLLAAVSQDYMCEPHMLKKTGLTIQDHQRLSIERYDALLCSDTGVYIMPVLQGYDKRDYVEHIRMYGDRLQFGAWVGVGSICKRNGDPRAIKKVLLAIHEERPDLKLHGFGLKITALASGIIDQLLHTADSMAWSFSARKAGRDRNSWKEAKRWTKSITKREIQWPLFI